MSTQLLDMQTLDDRTQLMTLNMGPQHPSTHGVLQVVLQLDGERVVSARPEIGYLHRGKEKIAEYKTWHKWIPYTDRMDYISPMSNNYGYIGAIEKLMQVEVTPRCRHLRTMLVEMARISSHLLWLGCNAMDIGAVTVFLYTFTEREFLYDRFEEASGARFTVSYMRTGGLARDVPPGWEKKVEQWAKGMPAKIDEWEGLLTENPIWLERTRGVGVIDGPTALNCGLTGPSLRASGVPYDVRRARPYLLYDQLDWNVATETGGDVYARYLVRIKEMRESVSMLLQLAPTLPGGPVNIDDPKFIYPPRERVHHDMESLIHQFLLASEGYAVDEGDCYFSIEAPKGELGFYIVSDGGRRPYRVKVRSPSFCNLYLLDRLCRGHMVSDVVANIGSLDIVLGEVDR